MRPLLVCVLLALLILPTPGCAASGAPTAASADYASSWRAAKRERYRDLWMRHLSNMP